MGNQQNTLHALNPRFTSSTHWSSNVIHVGRSSPLNLLGFTFSQKTFVFMFLIVWIGLNDQWLFIAMRRMRSDDESTEPGGGESVYVLQPK